MGEGLVPSVAPRGGGGDLNQREMILFAKTCQGSQLTF